jgi:cellobiose epimerase
MEYYIGRLNHELKNILKFWQNYAIRNDQIATEVSIEGKAKFDGPLGTVYVSRLLYGVSAACRHLGNRSFQRAAELAFNSLTGKLTNPYGGYHWAVDEKQSIIHDAMNYSFAQGFVVYGMSEYYALTSDSNVKKALFQQIDFIENKLKDHEDSSYLDGFNQELQAVSNQRRSLATHMHILEAYVKFLELTHDPIYNKSIENIIRILITKFIDLPNNSVYHEFTMNWEPEPNEVWIGHNLELAWILCRSAKAINHPEFIEASRKILLSFCENAIEKAFDKKYGGMFNRFRNDDLLVTDKEWWPQAESVMAFLTAYRIGEDKKYLSYAIRLLEYIDNTFSDQLKGEWYDSVTREGEPIAAKPKLHLWKSMYHNVRYCIEVPKMI